MSNRADALKLFFGEYVVALAMLIVAGGWLVWWIATTIQKMKSDVERTRDLPCDEHKEAIANHTDNIATANALLDKITEDFDRHSRKLPCAEHKEAIAKHSDSIATTNALLGRITGELDRHTDDLAKATALLNKMSGELGLLVSLSTATKTRAILSAEADFSEKHSPRQLNHNGIKIFNEIDGESFIASNAPRFLGEIAALQPKTALDVENFALAVLRASSNDDIFIPLKQWVYNAPAQTILRSDGTMGTTEVSLDDVAFILSIPLRDRYLAAHPELL